MSVTIGGVTVVGCQVEGCDRAAETTSRIWSPSGGRNEIGVCQSCAAAIQLGKKSESNSIW